MQLTGAKLRLMTAVAVLFGAAATPINSLAQGGVITVGRSTWSVNVPVRVHQDFQRYLVDIDRRSTDGGDFGRYLLLIGYAARF